MRTLALAALTMVSAFGATQAEAQRLGHGQANPGASYPMPGPGQAMPAPPMQRPPIVQPGPNQGMRPQPGGWANHGPRPQHGNWSNHQRWGGSVGGHWQGGVNAPGGWNAYRHPSRGYHMPRYWFSPSFFIGDYAGYGLSAPPLGYGWYRYYDDAVLLDSRGRVYDSVDRLDWDGGYGDDGDYAQDGYAEQYRQSGPRYAPLPPVTQSGNVTTYSTSSGYGGGGYAAGGYYYPGATTTVVTIQAAPSVTTTTTEYVETTRYVAARRVYHAPKKRYYRPVRRKCGCQVERPILGS
uniref:RcnB family protein n=1 Tax=uncultured Sphingomonas sp. TaxID=158754 RepID=UPI0035CC6FDB